MRICKRQKPQGGKKVATAIGTATASCNGQSWLRCKLATMLITKEQKRQNCNSGNACGPPITSQARHSGRAPRKRARESQVERERDAHAVNVFCMWSIAETAQGRSGGVLGALIAPVSPCPFSPLHPTENWQCMRCPRFLFGLSLVGLALMKMNEAISSCPALPPLPTPPHSLPSARPVLPNESH